MNRRDLITLLAGVAGWPRTAHAQNTVIPVIGFMSGRSPEDSAVLVAAFREGLIEGGFVEGQSVAIDFRWARGDYTLLPALAAELVKRQVAVLVAVGGDNSASAAKQATSVIPVVFGMGGDPVKAGLVESFSRPQANATGFTLWTNEMEPKRLGLLRELVPNAGIFGALVNPSFPPTVLQLPALEQAAATIGRQLFVAKASNDTELATAFTELIERKPNALLVTADPYFDTQRDKIIAFAAQNRLPTMYQFREYAVAGGLVSYGPKITDGYRQAGLYAARILKGAKPADLPVVQPTKFELVVNLTTAKAINLTVPTSILAGADEVIE